MPFTMSSGVCNKPMIHLIIPARNESQNISEVLRAVLSMPHTFDSIIVVDNGSSDKTAEVAKRYTSTVLHEPIKGYGRACLKGIEHIQNTIALGDCNTNIVAFLDADFSDYPADLLKVLEPIVSGQADFVLGSRLTNATAAQAVPIVARWGNRFAVLLIRLIYRNRFTDLGPMRAITWAALQQLHMVDTTWGWTLEMQLKACQHNLRTIEVPVRYRKRFSGKSQISGSILGATKAGAKILWVLITHTIRDRFCNLLRRT